MKKDLETKFILAGKQLRDYQSHAINSWLENDCQGILVMATGSGKTVTAIGILHHVLTWEKIRPQIIIITVPGTHLGTQWSGELRKFGYSSFLCHSRVYQWGKKILNQVLRVKMGDKPHVIIISTLATFIGEKFQSILGVARELPVLLISDEAHNMGAPRTKLLAPDYMLMRLALTATPERLLDPEGTEFIFRYFGNVVYEFGLQKAIQRGYLVPYSYQLHLTILSEDELAIYDYLTHKLLIALQLTSEPSIKLISPPGCQLDDELDPVIIANARRQVLVNANHKMERFEELLHTFVPRKGVLIYCSPNQFPKVGTILNKAGIIYRSLRYDNHTLQERHEILKSFEKGEIQMLVSINILNEGVDLPSITTAIFLASSTNPRQFIQRRGRVLRPFKDKNQAWIHDFIVLPPLDRLQTELELPKAAAILYSELDRVYEFAKDSLEGFDSLYDITHVWNNPSLIKRYPGLTLTKCGSQ